MYKRTSLPSNGGKVSRNVSKVQTVGAVKHCRDARQSAAVTRPFARSGRVDLQRAARTEELRFPRRQLDSSFAKRVPNLPDREVEPTDSLRVFRDRGSSSMSGQDEQVGQVGAEVDCGG